MDTKKSIISCYRVKNDIGGENRDFLNELYRSWRTNWFDLFEEISTLNQCNSDEFSKQDYFLALYLDNELAGSIGFRTIDMSLDIGSDDSYILPWPSEFSDQLKAKELLLMSGFNLAKRFRGRYSGLPSMFIFGTFIMQNFLQSENETLITIARNDAGVNKFCSTFGADKVGFSSNFHGKECDLMMFNKENVIVFPLKKQERILKEASILDYCKEAYTNQIGA